MTVESLSLAYLKSFNPLAQKIGEDIDKVIGTHQEKWSSLDQKAKEKLLDQAFIDSSLVKKYESQEVEQGDEDNYSELSTFSWFTRSQLNLFSYINVKTEKSRTPMKKTDVLSPLRKGKVVGKSGEPAPRAVKGRCPKEEKPCPKKPKTPPPPPPGKLVPANQRCFDPDTNQDDIPKTGFDFLDNW